jgi:hypothetical protein
MNGEETTFTIQIQMIGYKEYCCVRPGSFKYGYSFIRSFSIPWILVGKKTRQMWN